VTSDLPYLAHIADSIAAIETYVSGGREVYLRDRLIQDAVIRKRQAAFRRRRVPQQEYRGAR
jgi:hypothetical protein